ncbi:DUF4149 domain-containing protein [Helicobacter pylori]
MKKFGLGVYLLLLGILGGSLIILGAIVAPIVFKASSILPELNLTPFESGKLMAQIFVRFNYVLGAIGFVVLLYEIISFIYYKRIVSVFDPWRGDRGVVFALCFLLHALYFKRAKNR